MKVKESIVDRAYNGLKDFGRLITGQSKSEKDIQNMDTAELIRLLTHSTPDSDREKMVIKAIEHRITENEAVKTKYANNPKIIEELQEREKIYSKFKRVGGHRTNLSMDEKKIFDKYSAIDEKDPSRLTEDERIIRYTKFYDLNEIVHEVSGAGNTPTGADDSLITAAARYGHYKVVDLLVNKGKVDIFSEHQTGHSDTLDSTGGKRKSAYNYLETYLSGRKSIPSRKIDGSEYLMMPVGLVAGAIYKIAKIFDSSKSPSENEKSDVDIATALITSHKVHADQKQSQREEEREGAKVRQSNAERFLKAEKDREAAHIAGVKQGDKARESRSQSLQEEGNGPMVKVVQRSNSAPPLMTSTNSNNVVPPNNVGLTLFPKPGRGTQGWGGKK